MVKAKDIMTECVVSVKKDTPMYEVAHLMSVNDITGVPVVDDDMKLVGIVTEKDVLDLFDAAPYRGARSVNSSMSYKVTSFDVEDDLEDICDCLRESPFRRVPVTSDGRLVGIISRKDLILYMLKVRQKSKGVH